MSTVRKLDLKPILIVLISLAGSAYCAARLRTVNISLHPYSSEVVEAGILESKQDSVRRKGDATLLWDDLQNSQKVFWDDAISTGADSIAQLRLENDVQVTLMPSSLAVLSKEGGHISIDLRQGRLQIKRHAKAHVATQPELIQINGQEVDVSNASAIDVDQLTGSVKVIKTESSGERQAVVINSLGVQMASLTEAPIADFIVDPTPVIETPVTVEKILRAPALADTSKAPTVDVQNEVPVPLPKSEPTPPPLVESPTLDPTAPPTARRPMPLISKFWALFGLGQTFSSYTQQSSGFTDIHLGGINGPSQGAQVGFFASDHLGAEFKYQQSPGEVKSASGITVSNANYLWRVLSASLLYRPAEATKNLNGEWLWRAGVVQEEMPFLLPTVTNQLDVQTRTMTILVGGVERRWFAADKLRIQMAFNYNYPLSSNFPLGSSFKIQPRFSMDAGIGADYEFHPHFLLGLNWSGQYQDHSFDYSDNLGRFSGEQSFVYSTIVIRIGAEL